MTFGCPFPLNYTEGRDAQGHHLGLVNPGDIRDLDQAPDQWWHESTGDDRAALAARDAGQDGPGDAQGEVPAGPEGEPAGAPETGEPEAAEQHEPGE